MTIIPLFEVLFWELCSNYGFNLSFRVSFMVKVFFGIQVIASNMHGMTETMGSE